VCNIQRLFHQVAEFIVVVPGVSPTLLAYVALGAYEMGPGDRITPLLILQGALATLSDRLGSLQRMLTAFVLDRIVGYERIAAALDLAGAFHYSSGSRDFLLFAR
jgi:hypothetical protein